MLDLDEAPRPFPKSPIARKRICPRPGEIAIIRRGGCPKGGKKDVIQLIGDAVLTIDGDTAANADGDLDYNKGGRLTIRGEEGPAIDPPEIHQDFSDRILEITKQKGVKIEGLSMEGGGDVEAGGAVRVAQGASATLAHAHLHDNIAELSGGAIACEGCASLRLTGAFQIEDNLVLSGVGAQGGAVWSDAPTTVKGVAGGPFPSTNSRFVDNTADPTGNTNSYGGAIFASHNLTISDTYFLDNQAEENGLGGAIALEAQGDERKLTLVRSTLEQNVAGAGGGIFARADGKVLDLRRSAIVDNSTIGSTGSSGSAFGGGIFIFDGGGKIADSEISGNTATATASGDTAAAGGISMRDDTSPAETLKLIRSGVIGNSVAVGTTNQRGGGLVIQGRLETINTTIAGNQAPAAGAEGGGVKVETSGFGTPSARFDFTTFRVNSADNGNALATEAPVTIRASILHDGADGCEAGTGDVTSAGFNVEDDIDADCEIDAATDVHDADFLGGLVENGTFPVGAAGNEVEPLTTSFTNDTSSALDIVPPRSCKVNAKALKTDARGLPRPAEDGCDAGATERSRCLGVFVVGTDAHVGTKGDDTLHGSGDDIAVGLGGDDFIGAGSGNDHVCGSSGDDVIAPSNGDDQVEGGPGTDQLNYNDVFAVTGMEIDLAAGTSLASNGDADEFSGIEDAQGSEDPDEFFGDGGANVLIGGGGDDEINGRGGIDIIDAREPGSSDPDVVIDCGPGDNSKEKAIVDPEDPDPISC